MLTDAPPGTTRSSQGLTWKHACALAVLGTILSMVRQSFRFGVINNIFHIPIVLKLFNLEQFAHDPFYQSLRSFTSLVWPALSLVATPEHIVAVFLGAQIVSRLLLYLACIYGLVVMGVQSVRAILVFVLLLACGQAFMGYSMIGDTGLQIDYFTHTEFTYPFVVFALLLASRGRYLWAFAINGVIFNINAFVGVWMLPILAVMALAEPVSIEKKLKSLAAGGVIQGIISVPTAWWILQTIRESQGSPNFDYRTFLAYYFPKHFFIQASSLYEIVQFTMVCATGAMALYLLGDAARPWKIAFAGCLALFGVGAILPFLSSSRLFLNLVFLRIDGVVILLTLLFVASVVMPFLIKRERWGAAMAVLAIVALGDWRATALAVTIFAFESGRISQRLTTLAGVIFGGLSVVSQIGTAPTFQSQHLLAAVLCFVVAFLEDRPLLIGLGAVVASINFPILGAAALVGLCGALLWNEQAGRWIVVATGTGVLLELVFTGVALKTVLTSVITMAGPLAFFGIGAARSAFGARFPQRTFSVAYACLLLALLVPWAQAAAVVWAAPRGSQAREDRAWNDVEQWARMNTPSDAVFLVPSDSEGFQLGSYRHVWIDFRQGATVMWSPAYYSRWMERYPNVRRLKSHSDFYNYALDHDLQYYVAPKDAGECGNCVRETRIYGNQYFDMYRLQPSGVLPTTLKMGSN